MTGANQINKNKNVFFFSLQIYNFILILQIKNPGRNDRGKPNKQKQKINPKNYDSNSNMRIDFPFTEGKLRASACK